MSNRKKVVLVACGTGIATSTIVAERVEKLIKNNNLNATIIQCKMSEVPSKQDEADLLVTTTIVSRNYEIPVIRALNYLTNVNTEKIDSQIIEILQNK